MTIVKDNPNGDKSTVDGMRVFKFSGTPPDQYEDAPAPQVGDTRVMTVTVQCRDVGTELIDKGERAYVKWKIVNAEVGRVVVREDLQGTLDYESGADGQYSETYGTGQPVDNDGDTADAPAEEADEPDDAEPEPEAAERDSDATVHKFPKFSGGAK